MALTKIGTDGVKDDAITSGKIPVNAVGSSELASNSVTGTQIASNAVTANKIAAGEITNTHIGTGAINGDRLTDETVTLAKLPHGTSSNDGKFLRANNGADPTFESLPASGVTVSNNADNRVITGDGTNLNAESQLTYDDSSNILKVASASSTSTDKNLFHVVGGGTADRGLIIGTGRSTGASQNHAMVFYDAQNSESNEYGSQHIFRRGGHNNMVIGYQSNNYVGINNDYPNYELSVKATDSNESTIQILSGGNGKESNLLFGAPDDADVGAIKYDHNGDQMKFIVGTSEKFRVNSHGICIGGTGSANALDDYEEGTYTVTLTGQSAGSIALYGSDDTLSYTKVGNIVHISGRIRLYIVNNSMSGQARISLPFTAAAGTEASNGGMSSVATHGVSMNESSDIGMFLESSGNTSNGYLTITRYSQSWTSVTANQFGGLGATSNHYLAFNHTYQAA